ncbi:MAG TPA: SDR family NAD(P)-dependent oxidoreductase [Myxococcales bacterium]|nr:SDR family NAD(P)-dependent oxidoreductase [Myxococcales bacterium]HIL80445.1 SDR family NAD(P)-dependent oxidoreductase [Myxococcales bacterium]
MPNAFGLETTTDEVIRGTDLSGRHILITGASGGLGAETARALASVGARVTLAARDIAKAESVAETIRSEGSGRQVDVTALELTSLESVRDCAKRFLAENGKLDVLINNAGLMGCELARTSNGWELQLATNHIGHFLLTCLLVPALRSAAPARIVNLSSAGHRLGDVDFEDPHFESRAYDKWVAYGQSKTANILFTLELDRRLAPSGIRSVAVHPGMIMTELGRHLTPEDVQDLMSRADPNSGAPAFKSVEQGAATSTWAASASELEGQGGFYCEDCNIAEEKDEEISTKGISPHALNPESARRLWTLSEQWVGEAFPLN